MNKIVFVTNNTEEFNMLKGKFDEYGFDLECYKCDCDASINDMPKYKAMKIYNLIEKECFIITSRYYSNNQAEGQGFSSRKESKLFFINRLTYYDGVYFKEFYKINKKIITSKEMVVDKIILKLWGDSIPLDSPQFLSDITEEKYKNLRDGEEQIALEFIKWKHDSEMDLNARMESFYNAKRLSKKQKKSQNRK